MAARSPARAAKDGAIASREAAIKEVQFAAMTADDFAFMNRLIRTDYTSGDASASPVAEARGEKV